VGGCLLYDGRKVAKFLSVDEKTRSSTLHMDRVTFCTRSPIRPTACICICEETTAPLKASSFFRVEVCVSFTHCYMYKTVAKKRHKKPLLRGVSC